MSAPIAMPQPPPRYKTLEDVIGNTPLVRLQRMPGADNERAAT